MQNLSSSVPFHPELLSSCMVMVVSVEALFIPRILHSFNDIQGDHSSCTLGLVDIKTKVPFQYMFLILKHNICFDVNKT